MTQQEPRVPAGDYATVRFEVEGNVAIVTLNRPEVMNAFSEVMVEEWLNDWETHGLDREAAQSIGWHYPRIGNPLGKAQVSQETVIKPEWTLR